MKFSRARTLATLVATAAVALTSAGVMSSVTPQAAASTNSQVIFRDDFSGSSLNQTVWRVNSAANGSSNGYPGGPPQFGTGEVETVTNDPANVGVTGGNLYITPQRDAAGNWTSARIETNEADFKPPAGEVMHVEARLQMPNVTGTEAQGYWPAFWMLGGPYKNDYWSWPGIGEFDIMENVNGIDKNWSTLHCGVFDNSGPCNETNGVGNGGVAPTNGFSFQGNFHVFSFEWDRSKGDGHDEFRWYNDGNLVHTVRQDTPPALPGRPPVTPEAWATTWANMTQHAGYFIILNVAMGGQFPANQHGGLTAATKPGVPMLVDYVEVLYSGSATATASTVPTTASTSPTTQNSTTSPTTSAPSTTTATTTNVSATPTNLRLKAQTASSATLQWDGPSNATYDILRGEGGVRIASVTGNTFTDSGLALNTPYVYSVRGSGGTTSQITVTLNGSTTVTTPSSTSSSSTATPTTPPSTSTSTPPPGTATPTNLRVVSKTSSSITLQWDGPSNATYDILRGEGGVRIASVTGNTFTDSGLALNTPYVYSVRGSGGTTSQITVFAG